MLSNRRLTQVLLVVFLLLGTIFYLRDSSGAAAAAAAAAARFGKGKGSSSSTSKEHANLPPENDGRAAPTKKPAISYDTTTPPSIGCESLVTSLQQTLIETYTRELAGIRYANIYGYLETENKGDATIWTAQQILLATLGITSMVSCRFVDKSCDTDRFRQGLVEHAPHAAILMAGGGNFNDFYHTDHESRLDMLRMFNDHPVRAFPQSIAMTKPDKISLTQEIFGAHSDLHLAARDKPSFDWLHAQFGPDHPAAGVGVKHILAPDIAFMFGSRPDFRLNTNKTHNVLILGRDDREAAAAGRSDSVPMGEGVLTLSPSLNVTYLKLDWTSTPSVGIDGVSAAALTPSGALQPSPREKSVHARAWAKAIQGFEILAAADLVITDRLHGHIMSTIIGTPHVLMDSRLGKNLNFHNTWTSECQCTRIAEDFGQAREFARLFFEQGMRTGAPGEDG